MRPKSVTFCVSKCFTSSAVRAEHEANIPFMRSTFFVFQPLRSRLVNEVQPENMFVMLVTSWVSKVLRSSPPSFVQVANILAMFVTLPVFHPLRSRLSTNRHFWNMLAMFVTSLVFRFSQPSMVSSLSALSNQLYVEVGLACAKDVSKTTFFTPEREFFQPGDVSPVFRLYVLPAHVLLCASKRNVRTSLTRLA